MMVTINISSSSSSSSPVDLHTLHVFPKHSSCHERAFLSKSRTAALRSRQSPILLSSATLLSSRSLTSDRAATRRLSLRPDQRLDGGESTPSLCASKPSHRKLVEYSNLQLPTVAGRCAFSTFRAKPRANLVGSPRLGGSHPREQSMHAGATARYCTFCCMSYAGALDNGMLGVARGHCVIHEHIAIDPGAEAKSFDEIIRKV